MYNSQVSKPQKWKPFDSNTALEATCKKGGVFCNIYEKLKKQNYNSGKSRKGSGNSNSIKDNEVHVAKEGVHIKDENCEACMVVFRDPMTIDGKTKKYY